MTRTIRIGWMTWCALAASLFLGSAEVRALSPLPTSDPCPHCTECRNITPFAAYTRASQRAWTFECASAGQGGRVSFLPLASGELACVGKTGLNPLVSSFEYRGRFFQKLGLNTADGKLLGGWYITDYEVSGGRFRKNGGSPLEAASFTFTKTQQNQRFNMKLRRIVFAKKNGNCSKVLAEAF